MRRRTGNGGAIANGLFAAIGVRVRTLLLTAENVVQVIG